MKIVIHVVCAETLPCSFFSGPYQPLKLGSFCFEEHSCCVDQESGSSSVVSIILPFLVGLSHPLPEVSKFVIPPRHFRWVRDGFDDIFFTLYGVFCYSLAELDDGIFGLASGGKGQISVAKRI